MSLRALCGVWQKMHTLSSVADFIVPGPDIERLCFVFSIDADGGDGGGGGVDGGGGGGGGAWAVPLLANARNNIAAAAINTAVLEKNVRIPNPLFAFVTRNS